MGADKQFLMAIDQGTSSSRTVIFDQHANVVASAQQEFPQEYPQPGWVEHDPEAIWQSVLDVTQKVLAESGAGQIAGLGITNQRETTLLWNRETGECIHHAIVWQDRRTADYCQSLKEQGAEASVIEKTGLRLDPYFSATKVAWILEHTPGARQLAEQGKLAFGTIDCFLLWRLTGGRVHATDASNASRTLLFNIHTQEWDQDLLQLFAVPESLLPDVRDCAADFGVTDESVIGVAIPICGMAGDQQAALIGQAGFTTGTTKSTYGTGCFVIANTGAKALRSQNNLLTTVAYRLDGNVTYGLEGSIFVAGSAIQWLRDQLKVIKSAPDCEPIAEATGVVEHVHVVPAFAGLGAPYWDPNARAAILGLSRDSGADEIVTATLQSVAYQTKDLVNAMSDDGIEPGIIRVDGGMVANNWFLQFLADMLNIPVERPKNVESTVLGAAYLAGLQCGIFSSIEQIADLWSREAVFAPKMDAADRAGLYAGWQDAVQRVRTNSA
ncbi:MAG: glycerol kinase [Gammaproteobacteria bacterium]|nr:MAG: glycerol kinase [Gammaproteobacteria bacterium]RLA32294.1 MAG: glycerol kinase [Gammaproteobacteria bacterium]